MSKIFAIGCHSPEELIRELLLKDKKPKFAVLNGNYLKDIDLSGVKHIFVLSAQDVSRNWRYFNQHQQNIFCFISGDVAYDYPGIVPLDFDFENTDLGTLNIVYHDHIFMDRLDIEPNEICKSEKYVQRLIEDARKGSLLNALMTLIYKLPAKTHQKPIKILCSNFIVRGWPPAKLEREYRKLGKDIKLGDNLLSALLVILTGPVAQRLQSVFSTIGTDMDSADAYAKQHGVSAYEIRYIMQLTTNTKQNKKSVDEYLD